MMEALLTGAHLKKLWSDVVDYSAQRVFSYKSNQEDAIIFASSVRVLAVWAAELPRLLDAGAITNEDLSDINSHLQGVSSEQVSDCVKAFWKEKVAAAGLDSESINKLYHLAHEAEELLKGVSYSRGKPPHRLGTILQYLSNYVQSRWSRAQTFSAFIDLYSDMDSISVAKVSLPAMIREVSAALRG